MKAHNWFLKRLISFKYASQGILTLFRMRGNASIHLIVTLLVILFGFYFQVEKFDWIVLILCIVSVLAAEAFNSALEVLSDHITKEKNRNIKKVKDLAAGAVLVTAIGAAIVGILVFYPYIFRWVQVL